MDTNLIDMAEMFATKKDLRFNRIDDNEISLQLRNDESEYNLFVSLKQEHEMLCFSCDMNLHVPQKRYSKVADAIIKANEMIWVGHFDITSYGRNIIYSLTIPFISSFSVEEDSIESIVRLITSECDRFYYYFAMVIANQPLPDFAINALCIEAAGEA